MRNDPESASGRPRRWVKVGDGLLARHGQTFKVRSSGLTDRGRVRMLNEDQFLVGILARALRVQRTSLPQTKMRYGQERNYFFAVADGVSGQQGGEEASALAIDLVEQFLLEPSRSSFDRNGSPKKALL